MSHQHATLGDTVYLWFGANDTSGSGNDGATPVYDVRLGGAASDAIPTLSGSATLLSHANYPAGAHEVAIVATAGNGFAAGNTYGVFCTLLVDSQNPTGFVGSFTLGPIVADLQTIKTQTITCAAGVTFGVYVGGTAAQALASVCTEARLAELDAANLPADVDAIPTTAMRGTDSANTVVPPTVAQMNARTLLAASYATAAICTEPRLATLTDWINGGRLDLILDATLAMLNDARAEPGQGAPAVNADAMTKLDYLYKAWRNQATQTATEYALYNDAETVVDQKATVSDDNTTLTRGEIETGP